MSILSILEFPDPRLRISAEPVTVFDAKLKQFVADMFETMYAANGVGLAATQVNVHQRVLVADMSEGRNQPLALVNPQILEKDGSDRKPCTPPTASAWPPPRSTCTSACWWRT